MYGSRAACCPADMKGRVRGPSVMAGAVMGRLRSWWAGEERCRVRSEPSGQVAGDRSGMVGGMDEVVDQPAMRPGFAQGGGAEPAADRGRVCLGRIGTDTLCKARSH